jgi:hypothetical protein
MQEISWSRKRISSMRGLRCHARTALFSIVALLAAGCASRSSVPDWVQGERPVAYPKAKYMMAIGAGEDLEAARATAKSELSRIFSAELSSEARLIEEEATRGGQSTSESSLLVDTTIRTTLELQGVEVPLHWRDPKSGEIWALAVLERSRECLRIRSEGRDLSTQVDALAADRRAATNPLVALRSARQAAALGVLLDGLQARSRVLGMQCLPPRSVSTGALLSDLAGIVGDLRFVVNAREVDAGSGQALGSLPQLRERIAEHLTELGFQVGPTSGRYTIPIEARLRLGRVDRGTAWVEVRWEGSAEVGSPIPGEPAILAVQGEGAESHPEATTARLRARQKGEQELASKLDRVLRDYLEEGDGA